MTSSDNRTIVALFVRVPIPGRVKTRLAQDLGEHNACELYKAMVADILQYIIASGLPFYLFHDGRDSSRGVPHEWIEASKKVVAQKGENIGERMTSAFEYCFDENIDQVILVGSDIPGLDSKILLDAVELLKFNDVVIAPAADGGYCLIAMKQKTFLPNIFQNILWSTEEVLGVTLKKCKEFGLKVDLLEVLEDIDTIINLRSYCKNRSSSAYSINQWIENSGFHK